MKFYEAGTIIISILQMRKLRPRYIMIFALNPMAKKGQKKGLNLGLFDAKPHTVLLLCAISGVTRASGMVRPIYADLQHH